MPALSYEVFVTRCYMLCNEDLTIVKVQSPVHKDDFGSLATSLKSFFMDIHQVCATEVQPYPLRDAYIWFRSSMDREKILGLLFSFSNYSMMIIEHDEAKKARYFYLDREA